MMDSTFLRNFINTPVSDFFFFFFFFLSLRVRVLKFVGEIG